MKKLIPLLLAVLLSACATTSPDTRHPDDPWEPMNRSVYAFNRGVDRAIIRPAARGYVRVTPEPVRNGIGNFFRNLSSPVIMINLLLQGRGEDLEQEFQRFVVNTVYGAGGIFDLASRGDIEKNEADFGQTLAHWGWEDSRYLMLPFLGPSTIRDGVGRGVDTLPDIAWRETRERGSWALLGLRIIDIRAGLLPLDAELAEAFDEYALVRDGWLQRRNYFLFGDEAEVPDYEAFLEEGDWDEEEN
ncbi:MlaA family lipoprotein [Wenzhouxiangella marina]|uniref:Intercellular spreading VacJ lipoprotein n=1 Tax=Wenzhouxiangella marina TaxID=1579979 RepID=A0A0K0XXF5_9GAMM|nr:VacJ family lipoprotein [Wenzhouxiangella marina]AKS42312.1 intercellular spreading VacJ lipoprotein [Wenzhouxiangella marina]MBB6085915.1 phospholipid-binding lipoprotein MlaA [Wenzhouxiangella marina]